MVFLDLWINWKYSFAYVKTKFYYKNLDTENSKMKQNYCFSILLPDSTIFRDKNDMIALTKLKKFSRPDNNLHRKASFMEEISIHGVTFLITVFGIIFWKGSLAIILIFIDNFLNFWTIRKNYWSSTALPCEPRFCGLYPLRIEVSTTTKKAEDGTKIVVFRQKSFKLCIQFTRMKNSILSPYLIFFQLCLGWFNKSILVDYDFFSKNQFSIKPLFQTKLLKTLTTIFEGTFKQCLGGNCTLKQT